MSHSAYYQIPRPRGRTTITAAFFLRCPAVLRRMHERWRQREELGELEDYLLRDIGITREQARREAGKPFWR